MQNKANLENIYILNGNNTEISEMPGFVTTYLSTLKEEKVNPIHIGSTHNGFKLNELNDVFSNDKEAEYYNVIINTHGITPDHLEKHSVQINPGATIDTGELFDKLTAAANGKPLNIIMISCFGKFANTEHYLPRLPKGSILTTLSGNQPTASIDFNIPNAQLEAQLINILKHKKVNGEQFSRNTLNSFLVEVYCLLQRSNTVTPRIGIHNYDGSTIVHKPSEYTNHLKNISDSAFLNTLVDNRIVTKEHVENLFSANADLSKQQVKKAAPTFTIAQIFEVIDQSGVDGLIKLLDTFYPPNSFTERDFADILKYKKLIYDPFMQEFANATLEEIRDQFNAKDDSISPLIEELRNVKTKDAWVIANNKLERAIDEHLMGNSRYNAQTSNEFDEENAKLQDIKTSLLAPGGVDNYFGISTVFNRKKTRDSKKSLLLREYYTAINREKQEKLLDIVAQMVADLRKSHPQDENYKDEINKLAYYVQDALRTRGVANTDITTFVGDEGRPKALSLYAKSLFDNAIYDESQKITTKQNIPHNIPVTIDNVVDALIDYQQYQNLFRFKGLSTRSNATYDMNSRNQKIANHNLLLAVGAEYFFDKEVDLLLQSDSFVEPPAPDYRARSKSGYPVHEHGKININTPAESSKGKYKPKSGK